MASYSAARRNANAASNLAAAGIARRSGVSPYRQWRALSAQQRAGAVAERARRDVSYAAGGSMAKVAAAVRPPRRGPRPIREVTTGGGTTITRSGDQRVVRAAIERAAASGQLVSIKATFRTADGEHRTRYIDGTRDQAAVLEAMDAGGGGGGQRPGKLDGGRGRAAVEVVAGASPGKRGGGIDPADLLDYIDIYDGDVWDALFDLWDELPS